MADYKVVKGDNLSKLAKKFNTTVDALAALNNIKNKNLIKIGQTLKLPDTAQAAPGTQPEEPAAQPETQPWEQQINDMFSNSLAAQQGQIDANYNIQKSDYDKQINDAPKKYDPLRNEAYVNNAMAERSRKESMANMGLSGAGGASQTLQQRNTGALLNTLGDISRQQQDYTDNINFAIGKLTTKYNADTESLNQQTESERKRALFDQGNWEKSYGLQQDQLELSMSDSEFNKYMSLYDKKLITKKQMKDKFPQYGLKGTLHV
jgi:murein DD-endopeptidase MepM/ murein hydrolase activator NlpD